MQLNITEIQERITKLEKLVKTKKKEIEKLPDGHIRAITHGKGFQYYMRAGKNDKNGVYVPKKEHREVRKIVKKEYGLRVIKKAEEEIRILKRLLKLYQAGTVESEHSRMPQGKQVLVEPIEEDDETFVSKIISQKFEELKFDDNLPEYYTNKGMRVRSKSEALIANLLDKLEIKYIYEMPISLYNGIVAHPDFSIIDVKHRRIIYWEHFGMMDNEDYANNALLKINSYEKSGLYVGELLFATFESSEHPINMKLIEKKLNRILMN